MRFALRLFPFLLFLLAAGFSAQAQMCGQWTVTVDVVDEKGVPIDKASVAFTNLPEDDAANRRPFKKDDSSAGRFVVTFIEGDRVQKEYNLLIKAAGYQSRTSAINVTYCRATSHVIGLNTSISKIANALFSMSGIVSDFQTRNDNCEMKNENSALSSLRQRIEFVEISKTVSHDESAVEFH